MKKKSRRTIAKILIVSLALALSAASAFAGSSKKKDTEPLSSASYVSVDPQETDTGSVARLNESKLTNNDYYVYVLEVSTGVSAGHVESVNLRYASKTGSGGTDYAFFSQTLSPSQGAPIYYSGTDAGNVTNITDYNFLTKSVLGFSGTRFATYAPLFSDNESDLTGVYYGSGHNLYKAMNSYSYWAAQATGCFNAEYDNASKILDSSASFDSYTTEYIRFKTEQPITALLDLDFVITGTGIGDWSLNGWKLYKVTEWVSKNSDPLSWGNDPIVNETADFSSVSSTSEYTLGMNSTTINKKTWRNSWLATTVDNDVINCYAFLSDRLGLALTNATLVAQSQDSSIVDGGGSGLVGFENGIGSIRFVNPAYSELKNSYFTYNFKEEYYAADGSTPLENTYLMADSQNGFSIGSSYSDTQQTLNFAINIQNSNKAGIESFYSIDDQNIVLQDFLTAEIKYKNTWGYTEEVTVPVISDAFLEYAVDSTEINTDIASKNALKGFAQQGDSLCFSVTFPNFSSLESIDLTYKNSQDESDYLIIDSVDVYDDHSDGVRGGYYTSTTSAGILCVSIPEGSTRLYTTDEDTGNVTFDSASSNYTLNFISAEEAGAADYSDTYLVTVTTADVQAAGTESDIIMQFSYITTDGTETTTNEYPLSEACQEFYGYMPALLTSGQQTDRSEYDWWAEQSVIFNTKTEGSSGFTIGKYAGLMNPSISGMKASVIGTRTLSAVDSSYPYHMQQGRTIKFFVKAADLSKFTDVKVHSLDGSDLWQMDAITIQSVTAIGDRTFTSLESTDAVSGMTIYRICDRTVEGVVLYDKSDVGLLVNSEDVKELDLADATISGETSSRDYSEYYYNMSYDVASSNLHFDDAAVKYEIRVNVGGNSKSTEDDSCGSNNLFYFQLVFKNGVSGYVLANQQLYSDGFRTGQTETFYITTNEDYGDLTAVNIIPDDVSDDSDKLDKLNIDSIDVIKQSTGNVSKKYVVSSIPNDGWINMEYVDNSDSSTTTGRYAGEIVQSLSVTSSYYMLSLEVAIAYNKYPDVLVNGEYEEGPQFHGAMTADIVYVNSNNETKRISNFQLVQAMYSYDGISSSSTTSDTDWMFRGNSTDRFIVDIDDAISITSITLHGTPDNNVTLAIKEISVRILKSQSGTLRINNSNEYQMSYDTEPALLTNEVTRNLPENFSFPANTQTNYTFTFKSNEIPSFDNETSLESIVSRTPDSVNDTLNVYIYMGDGAVSPKTAGQTLYTKIQYSSSSTGKSYVTTISNYTESTDSSGNPLLSAVGISATNMSLLSSMSISADASYEGAYIDHAFIQQVRNGTVIDTYNVNFIGSDAASRVGVSMGATNNSSSMGESQTVTLQLGSGTASSKLTSQKYDIAVSLLYYSRIGDTSKLYASPYTFLTDSNVYTTHEGTMATFDFSEYGIKEIAGIRVAALNGLKVNVESGCIETYTLENDESTKQTGYYSVVLASPLTLSSTTQDITVTDTGYDSSSSMIRADFTFKTMESSANVDSGGTTPIRMIVHYANNANTTKTLEISDIRSYVSDSGTFTQGDSATVSLFLKGAKSLSYIELEPYDEDSSNSASWNLESVTYKLYTENSGGSKTIDINKTIRECSTGISIEQINLSSIVVELIAKGSGTTSVIARNSNETMVASPGESVSVTVNVKNTLPQYNYKYMVETAIDSARKTLKAETVMTDRNITFTVPSTATGEVSYVLTFSSEESETVSSSITIQVPVVEKTTEIIVESPAASSTSESSNKE